MMTKWTIFFETQRRTLMARKLIVGEMVLPSCVYIVFSPFQLFFRGNSYWFSVELGTLCSVSSNVLVVRLDTAKNAGTCYGPSISVPFS